MSRVKKQKGVHADIISSVKEAQVVAVAKVEDVIHCMETLRKEMTKAEAEFNVLKRNEAHLDRLEADAGATVKQYDVEHRALV